MSDQQTAEVAELPPLRLHHLLAWTAVTAAMLALYRAADETADWWIFTWLPGYLGGMLGLTIGGFGLYWRRRGLPFPSQPGHGLLIAWLIGYCFVLLWQLPFTIYFAASGGLDENNDPPWFSPFWQWYYYTAMILAIGLYICLAWWIRPVRRWQVFFVLSAVHFGASFIARLYEATLFGPIENLEFIGPLLAMAISYLLDHASLLFPSVALIVALIWDHRDGIPRHWSHWAGVVAWCSMIPGHIVAALINLGWLPWPVPMD